VGVAHAAMSRHPKSSLLFCQWMQDMQLLQQNSWYSIDSVEDPFFQDKRQSSSWCPQEGRGHRQAAMLNHLMLRHSRRNPSRLLLTASSNMIG
jgi:hypothetical protein